MVRLKIEGFLIFLFILFPSFSIFSQEAPSLNFDTSYKAGTKEEVLTIAKERVKNWGLNPDDYDFTITYEADLNYNQVSPGTMYESQPPTKEQEVELAKRDELYKKLNKGDGFWSVTVRRHGDSVVFNYINIDPKTGKIGGRTGIE